jgi:hypothetical protein
LFRPEVTEYLGRIYMVLVDLHLYDVQLRSAKGATWQEASEKRRTLRNELAAFSPTFRKLVARYVQMHQTLLWI